MPPVIATSRSGAAGRLLAPTAIALIAALTLTPVAQSAPTVRGFCIACGSVGGVDAVLNLLLFLPLGYGLGMAAWRWRSAFAAIVLVTATIEALQLTLVHGRDPSAGDIVMNSIGGAMGYGAAITRGRWLLPTPALATALTAIALAGWLGIQSIAAHALGLSLSERPWFGQMRRHVPSFAPFERQVGRVTLDGMALPEHRFASAPARHALLRRQATIRATLLPGPAPDGIAPIYRIADDRRREMLMLGRAGDALVFRVRMNAATLRLRRPAFQLADAFAGAPLSEGGVTAESTLVTARVFDGGVTLASSRAGHVRERTIRFSASWGWVLVMPFRLLLTSAATTLGTSLWLAGLLLPVGYWTRHAVGSRGDAPLIGATSGLLMTSLGLFVVPLAFGMAPAPLYEWAAATSGLGVGWLTAARSRRTADRTAGESPV